MVQEVHFKKIYEEHKKLVYNMCLNYVLSRTDAEDIAQEVFVKVYHNYHTFNEEKASLKTWICRIAINQSLDFLKAKKAKKRLGFLSSIFYEDTNEPLKELVEVDHPGIQLEQKEEVDKILKIIYNLPENQKTAIILMKIEGRSQKEVAEIMDVSVKALESIIQRAKTNINSKLEG